MSGTRVWWYFAAFFGVIVAVNAAMVTVAIRTHSGLVTEHPYEKGLAYNAVVHAQEKQDSLGWKGDIEYKNAALYFSLYDAQRQPITPENATATMTRPTQKGMDFTITLEGNKTPVTFPANGLWEVRVDVSYAAMHYQYSKRIVVP